MAKKKSDASAGGPLQMSFLEPQSNWKATPVSSLPSWAGAKRIALDCETKDIDLRELGPGVRRGSYTTGWGFKIEGGPKHYLPMRHEGGDNLPVEEVLRYLRHQIKNFEGEIIGANLSYDIDFASTDGIEFHNEVTFRDIQIADPLIYELHKSYSLDNIGKRWGVKGKETDTLFKAAQAYGVDPGRGMWRLPARFVGEYAENDVDAPLLIYEKQREALDAKNLWEIFDLESKVLPVLVRMRQRGVRIDFDKLEQIEHWSISEESEALRLVKRETGVDITLGEVWKANVLAPAIEALGVKLNRTSTGAPQIDAALLEKMDHPVATAIRHARKVNKIRTTFAASMRRYEVDGRIHCSFHQIIAQSRDDRDQKGVRYGRLSATDPNLQQQPSPDRDPVIAGEWRKIFIPEEGALWGCNDYSQQEPRWTTHFAALMDLPKAKEAARRYREDPNTDNHDMMTRLIHGDDLVNKWLEEDPKGIYKVSRGYAKNIFLGKCYGEGDSKVCIDIGLPTAWAVISGYGRNRKVDKFQTRHEAWEAKAELGAGYIREIAGEEGQDIIDNFDEEVPYVKELAKAAMSRAEEKGFVKTIGGRRLHFNQTDDGTYDWVHKALNRIIQGSSADQTKKAIVDIDRAGYFLQLQVHDETDGSYSSVKEAKEVGEIMKDSILDITTPLVPFNVDTECGPSWGEIKVVD